MIDSSPLALSRAYWAPVGDQPYCMLSDAKHGFPTGVVAPSLVATSVGGAQPSIVSIASVGHDALGSAGGAAWGVAIATAGAGVAGLALGTLGMSAARASDCHAMPAPLRV